METRPFFPGWRFGVSPIVFLVVTLAAFGCGDSDSMVRGQSTDPRYYNWGDPVLTDFWIDPTQGNDTNSGGSRSQALRTVTEAWSRIPMGSALTTTGYRLMFTSGTYPPASVPGYWESRYGSYSFPIILQAADGSGTASLPAMSLYDCRYLYIVGLRLEAGEGDVLHLEKCDHVLLRQMVVTGSGDISINQGPQETLKVNQSRHVYVEECDISGAWDNAVDFVGVQYGHLVGNRIHRSGDWCIYVKGGSAYFRVEANEIYDGGTGGFTAGQGTGFEFLTGPWLHYEAYDIKFFNNIVHDTDGAGMGVNGGYNILLAHNTLYRVGRRSHAIEVAFGLRGCDGDVRRCAEYLGAGGWGIAVTGTEEPIPDRNVFIYNNVIYNPADYRSEYQHFAVYGPRETGPESNVASPARTDVNLQIRGNIIWNGPAGHALGIEEPDQGCRNSNPTCNEAQLRAENTINTMEPQLRDPTRGDYRPVAGSNLLGTRTFSIPAFPGGDRAQPPLAPEGELSNPVDRDLEGWPRDSSSPPGAYAAPRASAAEQLQPVPPILPRIDEAMKQRLRTVLRMGQEAGNRIQVFAKIGDSITESASFLWDVGCGVEQLENHSDLAPVIDYFRRMVLPARNTSFCASEDVESPGYYQNSFNRGSVCAVAGWTVGDALDPELLDAAVRSSCPPPYHTPLACELQLLKPSVALIMYGTNDLERFNDEERFRRGLESILSEVLTKGVIPVLSTIPPRLDGDAASQFGARVAIHNQVIIDLTRAYQIPLWNYWLALQGPEMINQGMDADGVHPNVFMGGDAAVFSVEGLRYGYNQRNLTAIQALAKIKRIVIDDGPPDL
ncbi:MAG: right-handed parallel beta-helix repeat-containing protein [Acidobacteria bacterium]|nr:right-handed parallel beta-helix repeat-containing protein [Acidobacteriota bacterium]